MSVAAGLRHSLAVNGKLALLDVDRLIVFIFIFRHKAITQFFLFTLQTQAVCINGELASSVTLNEHSVHILFLPTCAPGFLAWFQVMYAEQN